MFYSVCTPKFSRIVKSWIKVKKLTESIDNAKFKKHDTYNQAKTWLLDNGYDHKKGTRKLAIGKSVTLHISRDFKIGTIQYNGISLVKKCSDPASQIKALDKALSIAIESDLDGVVCNNEFLVRSCVEFSFNWKRNGWVKQGRTNIQNVGLLRSLHYKYCESKCYMEFDTELIGSSVRTASPKWQLPIAEHKIEVSVYLELYTTSRTSGSTELHRVQAIQAYVFTVDGKSPFVTFSANIETDRKHEQIADLPILTADEFFESINSLISCANGSLVRISSNDDCALQILMKHQMSNRERGSIMKNLIDY
ncbi:viroplasmin family protein [Vibrio crassostreae]|uniref:ribonuclease H1 domain-containing protein n=1 Tax=Vibrio crassostreae TaxID=246167 RepID=UPI001B3017C6